MTGRERYERMLRWVEEHPVDPPLNFQCKRDDKTLLDEGCKWCYCGSVCLRKYMKENK
jgi:hypothetical protein